MLIGGRSEIALETLPDSPNPGISTKMKRPQPESSVDSSAALGRPPVATTADRGSRRVELVALAAILLAGLAIRLWSLRFPGYKVDVSLFTDWTNGLLRIPFDQYYGLESPWCDYLPGYLYILAGTGWLKDLISGNGQLTLQTFEPWIKAGPILADLVLGVVVFQLCRRFTGAKRSLLAASLFVFNPGVIFISSVWGQVESIASALYMLSLLALVSGSPILAAIWAGLGFVTKPQYAVFLGVIGIAYLRSDLLRLPSVLSSGGRPAWAGWSVRRVILPVAILIATAELLLLPFSTSLWPAPNVEWTFVYKVTNAEIGSFASAGAFNLWGTQIAGIRHLDSQLGWFHLSYQSWGFILFAVTAAVSLLLAWRRSNDPESVLWAAFLMAFGFFEVLTKMHERYLFPALPLIAAAVAFRLWLLPLYLAISALYFVNVWYIWTYQSDLFANQALTQWASDLSAVLFTAAVAIAVVLAFTTKATSRRKDIWLARARHSAGQLRWPLGGALRALKRPIILRADVAVLALGIALVIGVAAGWTIEGQSSSSSSAFQVVTVRAYRSWQDTGVKVIAGQKVSMLATGLWMNQMDGALYGPAGSNRKDRMAIMPSAPVGVLIGRIGEAAPFVVGEGTTLVATTSGKLRLAMNDWPNKKPGESRGVLRVAITSPSQ